MPKNLWLLNNTFHYGNNTEHIHTYINVFWQRFRVSSSRHCFLFTFDDAMTCIYNSECLGTSQICFRLPFSVFLCKHVKCDKQTFSNKFVYRLLHQMSKNIFFIHCCRVGYKTQIEIKKENCLGWFGVAFLNWSNNIFLRKIWKESIITNWQRYLCLAKDFN